MADDTCRRCGYQWGNDPLEWIAHLRTHPDIMADQRKRIDLDRWEQNHRQYLEDDAKLLAVLAEGRKLTDG